MENYFRSTDDTHGGMICEGEVSMDDVFDSMKKIHRKSFQELGGEYIQRDNDEKTCAIRLAPNTFFQVHTSADKKDIFLLVVADANAPLHFDGIVLSVKNTT